MGEGGLSNASSSPGSRKPSSSLEFRDGEDELLSCGGMATSCRSPSSPCGNSWSIVTKENFSENTRELTNKNLKKFVSNSSLSYLKV
jgi:hypothetical protein